MYIRTERKAAKAANIAKAAKTAKVAPEDMWQSWQPWQPSMTDLTCGPDRRVIDIWFAMQRSADDEAHLHVDRVRRRIFSRR